MTILDTCRQIIDTESGRVLLYRDEVEAVLTSGDTISRQQAIDALYDWSEHSMTDAESWHIRQVIVDIKSLPPAEPSCSEIPNNSDCISRQAAIDALDVLCQEHRYKIPGKRETYNQYNEAWQDALDRAEGAIFNLPSAQPEIIRCKDCRYSIDEYGDGECYCKRPSRELVWIGKRWDFFCAAARLKMEVEHE